MASTTWRPDHARLAASTWWLHGCRTPPDSNAATNRGVAHRGHSACRASWLGRSATYRQGDSPVGTPASTRSSSRCPAPAPPQRLTSGAEPVRDASALPRTPPSLALDADVSCRAVRTFTNRVVVDRSSSQRRSDGQVGHLRLRPFAAHATSCDSCHYVPIVGMLITVVDLSRSTSVK